MNTLQVKTSVQPLELQRLLAEGGPAQLVDVRTPGEFAAAHVPGARLIPLGDLDPAAFRRERGAEDIPLYVLCQSGGRARKAIEKLERAGVHGCVLVEGGTQGWIDAGLPVTRGKSKVLPLMRQVQIIVGLISALGAVLALSRQSALCHHPVGHWAPVLCSPGSRAHAEWRYCWRKCRGIAPNAAGRVVKPKEEPDL